MSAPVALPALFQQLTTDGFTPVLIGKDLLTGSAMAVFIKANGDWAEIWALPGNQACVVDGGSKLQPFPTGDAAQPSPAPSVPGGNQPLGNNGVPSNPNTPPVNPDPRGPHVGNDDSSIIDL
jgi:hypothetical protein